MTRPGFGVITVVACLLGIACAWVEQPHAGQLGTAVLTVVLAALAHAAANAINDYYDALNGADAANTEGLFPFTGGSRLIQTQQVRLQDSRHLALGLLLPVVVGGAWLIWHSGTGLLWIGLLGVGLGWAYSAPPVQLMSRGLGEFAVGATWWLVVQGAYFVQTGQVSVTSAATATSLALLVANILLINGLPDAASDALVGKRTLAVRLGPTRAASLYGLLLWVAHLGLAAAVVVHATPIYALWGLVSLPVSVWASAGLWHQRHHPSRLRPAIVGTIAAAVLHGLGMALGLFWGAR